MPGQGSKTKGRRQSQSQPNKSTISPKLKANETTIDTVPVKPKLQKRFYEALVLLNILGRAQGDHIDEEPLEQTAEPSELVDLREIRRTFLKQLAYICDSEKGGDTTTALVAEQTPQGVVLWIASNRCSEVYEERVKLYLDRILRRLRHLRIDQVEDVEEYIVAESVKFCSKRLVDYQKFLRDSLKRCIVHLEKQASSKAIAGLTLWLRCLEDYSQNPKNVPDLCRLCYESRKSSAVEELSKLSGDGMSCATSFRLLRHHVGRLGQTLKAANIIVHVALQSPQLCENIRVNRIPSSQPSSPPLRERNPSLSAIVGRMTSGAEIELYRQALGELDQLHNLSSVLKGRCQDANWKPRVHAELLLLDYSHNQHLTFVGNDRYIAISKPSCYCCYHYILAHPGDFVPPACHNNTYLNWRAPDVRAACPSVADAVKLREDILNAMAKTIRQAALRQVADRRGPRDRQFDSTTGFSSATLGRLPLVASGPGPSGSGDKLGGEDAEPAEDSYSGMGDEGPDVGSLSDTPLADPLSDSDSDGGGISL